MIDHVCQGDMFNCRTQTVFQMNRIRNDAMKYYFHLIIFLLFLVHQSGGITLTGSSYGVPDQTYQFTCTATEASAQQTLSFRRYGGSVCTLINLLNSTQCRQFIASPGYTCSCGQNGVYYMNISSVSLQDENTWYCQLSVGSGISPTSNNISLPVYYGPFNNVTLDKTSPVTVIEGVTTGSVRCSAHCKPGCSYTWRKGNQQVFNTKDLPLWNLTKNDGGDYTCRVSNTETGLSATADSQTLTVNIQWYPAQPTHNCPSWILLGQSGSCTCQTSDTGNPAGTVQWINPQEQTVSSSQSTSVSLNLANIPRSDNRRNYICRANNSLPNSNRDRSYNVNIAYPPDKPTITDPGSLCEGMSTSLTCSSFDPGNPPATYYWTKNNVFMATGNPYTFTLGRDDQKAQIRCEAGNNHTDRSGHSRPQSDVRQLNVYYVPRMTIIPAETQTRLEGQNISLVCSADSNPDNAVLGWSFNGISLPGSRLEKTNLNISDTGEYTCTGRVNTGSVCPGGFLLGNSHVSVNVFTAPTIPGDLIAWSTGPGAIKLSWKIAERDGLKQRFVVEYKEDGDTWKNSTESYKENGKSYVQGYVRGLQPETLYFLRVKSVTDIGSSDFTEEVQVLTKHSISSTENQNSQESSRGNIILGIGIALIVVATAAALLQVFLFLKIKRSLKRAQQEQYASFQSRDGNTYDELKTTVYQNTELTTSE